MNQYGENYYENVVKAESFKFEDVLEWERSGGGAAPDVSSHQHSTRAGSASVPVHGQHCTDTPTHGTTMQSTSCQKQRQ